VCEFIIFVRICSDGSLSPAAQTANDGGTTINEILHETAKYELRFYRTYVSVVDGCAFDVNSATSLLQFT